MLLLDPWLYLFAALLVLTLPLSWLAAALFAAAFHELCHALAIRLLGGRILRVRIGISGAVMETEIPGSGRELLCALAGPAGSFLLLFLCHIFPKIAICAAIQGLFNLLPLYPLDGGRALRCAAELLLPGKADRVTDIAEIMVLLGAALLAAAGTFVFFAGPLPILMAFLLILRVILRKRPCKRRRIGVQ